MVINLTTESFKEKVFDFEKNKDWVFEGDKPSIIKFEALWCGPCKTLTPIIEDLSEEFKDKLDIYKVNVDDEPELSQVFGIKSIPSLLFIPMNEQPQMAMGAFPKDTLKNAINETLKVE